MAPCLGTASVTIHLKIQSIAMEKREVKRVLRKISKIDGWFSDQAALLIALFNKFQQLNNIKGNIFEIGVHHGKSTVFFEHLLDASEHINICDIFDSQENNVSLSGSGNKDIFLRNMEKHTSKGVSNVYSCLSSELDLASIGSGYRMFHIDGGHNSDEALADLILAAKLIQSKGIIILDDPFRAAWPGVTEAFIDFLKAHKDFEAIVVGFNKLIIVRKEVAPSYIAFLDNEANRSAYELSYPYSYKKLPFLDSELRIFYTLSTRDPKKIGTIIKKRLRYSPLFNTYSKIKTDS